MKTLLTLLPMVACYVLSVATCHADTHYVVSGNAGALSPYTTWPTAAAYIQDALDASADGDKVLLTNGTFVQSGVSITKAITLCSVNGAESTVLNGNKAGRCLNINNSSALVEGLTITNGQVATDAGGVFMNRGRLRNCTITCNSGADGGGVTAMGGVIENCRIANNWGSRGGGGILTRTYSTIISNCFIHNNSSALYGGGGIYVKSGSGIIVDKCTIVNNTSSTYGGGLTSGDLDFTGLTVRNSRITDNSASSYGGGLFLGNKSYIESCTIAGNSSPSGSGGGRAVFCGCREKWWCNCL